jgi:antitoxin component YwqK of YwqJK toxin-antitoxin module
MRFIAFIVFSLLCLPAFARSVEFEGKQVREYTKEWTDDYYNKHKVVYHGYRGDDNYHQGEFEIWHGPAVFYSMGRKALEGTYRNGKRDGLFTSWSINGAKTERTYLDGVVHGKVVGWHENGKKSAELIFEHGTIKENSQWDTKGNLVAHGTYKEGGEWEGTFLRRGLSLRLTYKAGKQIDEEKFICQ